MNSSRRYHAISIIILASLVISLMSCSEAPFEPFGQNFKYPLAVGSSWDFAQTDIYTRYDTASTYESTDTVHGNSSTVVYSYGYFPGGSTKVYTFYTEWANEYSDGWRSSHYNNHSDGFYYYGGVPDIWNGPPKLNPTNVFYEYKGLRATSLGELTKLVKYGAVKRTNRSLTGSKYEEPPIRELAYPPTTGTRWNYRDTDLGHVWNMEKEIIGVEKLNLPAGSFECFKVRWYWDTNHDGQWDTDIDGYDYVSSVGTVRRQFIMSNIVMRDYTNVIIGYYNVIQDFTLTDYDLK